MKTNSNGVYIGYEKVLLPLPTKKYQYAEIRLAVDDNDHLWRMGYAWATNMAGCGCCPSIVDKVTFKTREEALKAGLKRMIKEDNDFEEALLKSSFVNLVSDEEQLTLF